MKLVVVYYYDERPREHSESDRPKQQRDESENIRQDLKKTNIENYIK